MKDTFYFTHDYNARQDFKIKNLYRKHGAYGYGIFWSIIEDLYNNTNALPLDYESMSIDYKCDIEVLKSVIHDFQLFQNSNTEFGSLSVQKRLDERAIKSQKARDSAQKRWSQSTDNQEVDANALPTESDSNAIKKEIEEKKETNKESNLCKNEFSPPPINLEKEYNDIEKTPKSVSEFIQTYKPTFTEPYQYIWNIFAERYGFTKITKITNKRLTGLKNRLKEKEFDFIEILKVAGTSNGLTGNAWFDFDFLIANDNNYIKVLEGKYLKNYKEVDKKPIIKNRTMGAQSKQLTPEQLKAL